jgi:dimethylaniline monooxygenase (N-oxide forming)
MAASYRKPGNHVCVVGAGTFGLNAAKNLLEQGLEVTVFERWQYIGGNWHPSDRTDQTAALDLTTKNTSKQVVRAALLLSIRSQIQMKASLH